MNHKKWAFIVNPIAGNHDAKIIVPKLKEEIEKRNLIAEIVFTEKTGHAVELSKSFLEKKFDYIITVGGDGTFNEVTKPLVNQQNVKIGIIPCGTGNDFVQILGFQDRFSDDDWNIFFEQKTKQIDVGICNGKTFNNGMGLGFDAHVAAQNYVAPGVVKRGSKAKYYWHIIKTILFYKEKMMKIVLPESKTVECFLNTVSIGRRFAGGFFLTPKAIADDGLFDICFVGKVSVLERMKILPMVTKGTHTTMPQIDYYQSKNLTLEFDHEVPYHLDGELFFSDKFEINVLPKALNIIYNEKGNHYFI